MTKTSNPDGLGRQLWQFFASVKLSVVIFLSLAATSIIGTVIPQNENPMLYHRKFGDVLFTIFNTLEIFDMYHSWWFRLLLFLLTVNIIVCSINRLQATWKIIFPKKASFHADPFRRSRHQRTWTSDSSPEAVKSPLRPMAGKTLRPFYDATHGKWLAPVRGKGPLDPAGGICRALKHYLHGGRRARRIFVRV